MHDLLLETFSRKHREVKSEMTVRNYFEQT